MNDEQLFVNGCPYEELFQTPGGWVALYAEIATDGTQLRMSDLSIEPMHTAILNVGLSEMLKIRRQVLTSARSEGYTDIVVQAWRRSGAAPNRFLRLRGKVDQ